MLQEGQTENALKCIRNIRSRYDGRKRNPFCETEAGYHYARAMASWSSVLALTGFHYSAVKKDLKINDLSGRCFWSNGYAYGTIDVSGKGNTRTIRLNVLNGEIELSSVTIEGFGIISFKEYLTVKGEKIFQINTTI